MNMIRHYDPIMEQVAGSVKVLHRIHNKFCDLAAASDNTCTLIQMALNFSPNVARNFVLGIIDLLASLFRNSRTSQALCLFTFSLQQNVLR